jgi:hypothetical protein
VAVFVKAVIIGIDLVSGGAHADVLRTVFIVYVVVAALAVAARIWNYEFTTGKRRRKATAPGG